MIPSKETTQNDAEVKQFIGKIPVRNWWLLLLYASHLYRELNKWERGSVEEMPDEIPDILAEILVAAVQRRLRRNLTPSYRARKATLRRVRGRIDIFETTRRRLLEQAKVSCSFEELTIDMPLNRFVKMALMKLSGAITNRDLARKSTFTAMTMERMGVQTDVGISLRTIPLRAGLRNAEDRRMFAAAKLAFDLVLLNQEVGNRHYFSPNWEVKDWHLFEEGIAGFYAVVFGLRGWSVRSQRIFDWQITERPSSRKLPKMKPDITLEKDGQRIIIDTKFYDILREYHGKSTFSSANIYQMYAYLHSQEGKDLLSDNASGILLHPTVDRELDEYVTIQNHKIRFATVNLTASASEIRGRLIEIVENQ